MLERKKRSRPAAKPARKAGGRGKPGRKADRDAASGPRGLWSGSIAFGLVNVPVHMLAANRSTGPGLRMLAPDGTPLRRVYTCPSEGGKRLEWDEIVRGYELEDGRFIRVTDEELDALEPEKSREIDLRRFVPVADIDPMYFERAYFLVPNETAMKAYRLLARAMEDSGRAGIATFVMRGKEYLVAIISERGLLRAETMRFHDEVRSPKDVGLTKLDARATEGARGMERAIRELSSRKLDREELSDREASRLSDLVRKKLAAGKDVVEAAVALDLDKEERDGEEEDVDVMEVLKESLRRAAGGRTTRGTAAASRAPAKKEKRTAPIRAKRKPAASAS